MTAREVINWHVRACKSQKRQEKNVGMFHHEVLQRAQRCSFNTGTGLQQNGILPREGTK